MSLVDYSLQQATCIGLGGNIGTLEQIVGRFSEVSLAVQTLVNQPVTVSSLYESAPVGPIANQPFFLNAVLAVDGQPIDIAGFFDFLQTLEQKLGMPRQEPAKGPREIDIDLLVVGRHGIASERLNLPHPEMTRRRFVLAPLAELFGGGARLGQHTLAEHLARPEVATQLCRRRRG